MLEFEPGDKVINPLNKDWGIGQVQSIINNKITVNFQNVGKKVINSENIKLEKFKNNDWGTKKRNYQKFFKFLFDLLLEDSSEIIGISGVIFFIFVVIKLFTSI